MQTEIAGVMKDEGLQVSALTARGGKLMAVTVPPVAVTGIGLPNGEAPSVFVSEIDVLLVTFGESATFTVAATPFETTLPFIPVSRHI